MSSNSKLEQSRHAEIDQMIDATADLLGDIRVVRALGPDPGRFLNALSYLYPPNQRGNRLLTPKEHKNDTSLPVVMLRPGETVYPSKHMTTLHTRQIETLENVEEHNEPAHLRGSLVSRVNRELDAAFASVEPISREADGEVIPQTISTEVIVTIGSLPRVVKARPGIYVPRADTYTQRDLSLVLFHQLVHAVQNLTDDPVLTTQTTSHRVINENEARALETRVALASIPIKFR